MLSLYRLSQWASHNSDAALKKASDACKDQAAMLRALTAPPATRLMQACRKNGPSCLTGKWESLLQALPERMLASFAYFIGSIKDASGRPCELPADIAITLQQWRTGGLDPRFEHLDAAALAGVESILVCHGLSPVGDSILLLADLGRAHRVASALGLSVNVMLASADWQKDNRSLNQLHTLPQAEAHRALESAQQDRLTLYAKLGIKSRPFATDRAKLKEISEYYRKLAEQFWQVNTTGELSIDQQKSITRALDGDLEQKHEQDLRVLRFFAKHFNGFDPEYFWYFLNQYFAQLEFQGNSLKVAVESEEKFDRNFKELNDCFARWGEADTAKHGGGLPVVYLPQYKLGQLQLLPYTPLSLDLMRLETAIKQDHRRIRDCIVPLDEDRGVDIIAKLLLQTPLRERNRLVADLLSFLCLSARKLGSAALNEAASTANISLATVLSAVGADGSATFEHELKLTDPEALRAFWAAGIHSALSLAQPSMVPLQLTCQLFETEDWTKERTDAFAQLCRLCRAVYAAAVS